MADPDEEPKKIEEPKAVDVPKPAFTPSQEAEHRKVWTERALAGDMGQQEGIDYSRR
jgi:hypothetical protein